MKRTETKCNVLIIRTTQLVRLYSHNMVLMKVFGYAQMDPLAEQ